MVVGVGPGQAGLHRDRERVAAVRHRHLEQRVVPDHDQVPGGKPSRAAAARSAVSDGFPVTVRRQPVMDLIMAEIARDVPSARPPAAAKNGVSDAEHSAAPDQTAWQAASRCAMVNSRNQPTKTASTAAPAGRPASTGGTTSTPAARSGSVSPSPPSTIDPLVAAPAEDDDRAGRRRHHPRRRARRARRPAAPPRMRGVRLVPLVNTT